MTNVDTAKTLALVGAILSIIFGVIYLLWGIALVSLTQAAYNYWWYKPDYWVGVWMVVGLPFVIYGIISLIFGILTLIVARKRLYDASALKTGAIMCFIFGGISAGAIGGILTIVAGVLAIIAWNEQRRTAETPPPPP